MKYTGMPWDIWTLITPLFREQCREEKTRNSFRCRHSGYRFDTSFLSPYYVITQHYRFFSKFTFKKSSYDSKKTLTRNAHLPFDSSVVSETAPSSRSVTT